MDEHLFSHRDDTLARNEKKKKGSPRGISSSLRIAALACTMNVLKAKTLSLDANFIYALIK